MQDGAEVEAAEHFASARLQLVAARVLKSGRNVAILFQEIGKLFLAEMPNENFNLWLAHTRLEAKTSHTIVRPADIRNEIRIVRKDSWATNREELFVGVIGCAVPIRDFEGRLMAGLGISVPSTRKTVSQLHEFRSLMEAVAADLAATVLAEK